MLECNQVAYIVLGVQRKIGYKKGGNFVYQVLPDGTYLDNLDRRKIYHMYIKEIGSKDVSPWKRKENVLLGTKIESCIKPEWDYRKFKVIDLKKIEKKIREKKKLLIDILNAHDLNIKEEELQLYLIAVHA